MDLDLGPVENPTGNSTPLTLVGAPSSVHGGGSGRSLQSLKMQRLSPHRLPDEPSGAFRSLD